MQTFPKNKNFFHKIEQHALIIISGLHLLLAVSAYVSFDGILIKLLHQATAFAVGQIKNL